jgi:hypothetical protein
VSAPIPPASSYNPELPPEVDDVLARGLAKQPEHRYASCADFVNALQDALHEAAGRTTVGALPASPVGRRRVPIGWIALGAALLAGIVAASLLAGRDDEPNAVSAPQTVKETVTLEGTTIVETVTTVAPPTTTEPEPEPPPPPPQPPPPPPPPPPASSASPAQLNDQGYALMQAGDFQGALPLLEQAVAGLAGSGETAEAYASYNLAFTRLSLGSCDGVIELLNRSEQVQGERKEISRLRKQAERGCGEGDG